MQGIFRAAKLPFRVVDTHRFTSKPLECTAPRTSPDVNCGLGDEDVPAQLHRWEQTCSSEAGVGNGRLCLCVGRGQEVCGKTVHLPFDFSVNLKFL